MALGPLLVLLSGCSGASDAAEVDRAEDVGEARSAVTFPGQVSANTTVRDQSETELVFGSTGTVPTEVVAYNDFDSTNDNLLGWAVSVNGATFVQKKPTIPTGYRALGGDPVLAVAPSNDRLMVLGGLATPNCAIPGNCNAPEHGDACLHASNDGGQNFVPFQCLKPPASPSPLPNGYKNFYDGGSIAGAGSASAPLMFASYLNIRGVVGVETNIHFFISSPNTPFGTFVRTTGTWDPFPGRLAAGHPKIAADSSSGAVVIVAPFISVFPPTIELRFHAAASFGGFLGDSAVVSIGMPPQGNVLIPPFDVSDYIVLGDGRKIRQGPEFDVAVGQNESGQPEARVAYVKRAPFPGDGRLHLYGARCTLTPPVTCVDVPEWSTVRIPLAHDEFHPRITYANGKWAVAFYTTFSFVPDPSHVGVAAVSFSGDGSAAHPYRSNITGLASSILPCSRDETGRFYWTDYDDIKYNATADRFVTTYSGNGCPARVFQAELPPQLWVF